MYTDRNTIMVLVNRRPVNYTPAVRAFGRVKRAGGFVPTVVVALTPPPSVTFRDSTVARNCRRYFRRSEHGGYREWRSISDVFRHVIAPPA